MGLANRKEAKTEDGKLSLSAVEEVYSKGRRVPIKKNEPFLSMMKVLVNNMMFSSNDPNAEEIR